MEKPLTDTLAAADALIFCARKRGVQLQVGHIERYNRALRAAEPFLDGPRYIESQRLAPFQPRGTDVAVVLDLMIHDLDLVLHLTGGVEATEVRASGLPLLSSHLDLANARVEFANGAVALATASRVSRERIRRLRVFHAVAAGVAELRERGWLATLTDATDPLPKFVPAVVEAQLPEQAARCGERKRTRQAERMSGIIEVEINGVTVWVGRGAETKTVAAVLRALKAGA